MLRTITRGYWKKGEAGYHLYKREIIDKQMGWPTKKSYEDPLIAGDALQPFTNSCEKIAPVIPMANYIRRRPNAKISGHSVAYVSYHASKQGILDGVLWKQLEFHILKELPNLNERMLFGCFYGLIRSNYGKLDNFVSISKEFSMKTLPQMSPFECFELIDAAVHNKRSDYSVREILHENVLPRYNDLWKYGRFVHIPSYLLRLMNNLLDLEIFDTGLWSSIVEILHKQSIHDIKIWEPRFRTLLRMRELNLGEKAEVDIDSVLSKYEKMWENNIDFQWRYNLKQKRWFTVHELIEQAGRTKSSLTWEEGEKMIKQTLPNWYWMEAQDFEIDMSGMLEEYEELRKYMQTKK